MSNAYLEDDVSDEVQRKAGQVLVSRCLNKSARSRFSAALVGMKKNGCLLMPKSAASPSILALPTARG